MTYSSSQPTGNNDQADDVVVNNQQNNITEESTESVPFEVDPYGGESRGYTDESVSPMGVELDDWQANIDYFVGCRTLSEETIDALQEVELGEGLVPRLPCKIAGFGGTDEEAFVVNDLKTSLAGDYNRIDLPPGINTGGLFPYLDLILEHGVENVNPPNPFGPGVKEYDPANANVDDEGYAIPQFRFCECVNYPYAHGWDYVDYGTRTPFRGQIGAGESSLRVKTAPFGPPQTRNNEVNNAGRHQMQSERGFAWFKQKPRRFIYIHPHAEEFEMILGTDEWQSGPSQCDITDDEAVWGAGIFTSPGGKNNLGGEYPFHLKYTTKYGGKIMLFSAGHSFNDKNVGGVEGQEYGVCGVSGWMVPRPDTCLGGVGKEYYANCGLKYVYAAYRFDASLREILDLIIIFGQMAENAQEVDDAIDGTGEYSNSRNFSPILSGHYSGLWDRAKAIKFELDNEAHMLALASLMDIATYSLEKNKNKADKDIDWNFDGNFLVRQLEARGTLSMYDVYNYIFPRQTIPNRALELLQIEFDIDEYIQKSTDYNIDGDRPDLDELEEKYEKFAFLSWAFGTKGADGVAFSEDEGDFLVTWNNGMSLRFSEYIDLFSGGWFDACVRCGGSIVANTRQNADGSVVIDEYRCMKTVSVAEPEDDADLGEEEQIELMTFQLPAGEASPVANVITDEDIFSTYDVETAEVFNPFSNPDSEAHISPMSTRGANRKYLSTEHEAAQMTDWDYPHDLEVTVFASLFSDSQPNWAKDCDAETVIQTTQAFRMKRKVKDEQGRESTIDEMQRIYNWWNSSDDHEHGVTIWASNDKNSLSQKDWVLAYVMKGASSGGNVQGSIDPAVLLDRKKNPDIQVGRPARGVDRYKDFKYFRVTAFSNKRKIGTDDNGRPIYAGEKIDVAAWPKKGKKERIKIWPNTTGIKPNPEDLTPTTSGPAYWSSNVFEGTGGLGDSIEENDWAQYPPAFGYDDYWKQPTNAIPITGGKVYEFKPVRSGGVTNKYSAPDLNITWSDNPRYNEILQVLEDGTILDFYKDFECDRAVLTRDMSSDCKVYAQAPANAKWVAFGAHNTMRDLDEFQNTGEPWALVSEVPAQYVNTRLISGPMYWSGNGFTENDKMPPFNNGRWKESLNTYAPHNSAIRVEPGKTYKITRLLPPENTPYNVSVISIVDEKGLTPRASMGIETIVEENRDPNVWKSWYKHEGDLPLEVNHITFEATSEWIVFGAYGHSRPLDDWSTDGEPCIFGFEEVKPIKGPDYYAGQPINLINNQLIGYPDLTENHWTTPLNPISEFDNEAGRKEYILSGNVYEITIPNQIQGKKMSFVWGQGQKSKDPQASLENLTTLLANSQSTGFWPFDYYKRSRNEDGTLAEILPVNESGGKLTYRVTALGDHLFFGSHDFRTGYERTLESWEKGGEPYDVKIRKLDGETAPKGPVYWAKAKPDIQTNIWKNGGGAIEDGHIHFESYWWQDPWNKREINDDPLDHVSNRVFIENPEFEANKPQMEEKNNEYFLYWHANDMQGQPRKLYSVWVHLEDKILNRSALMDYGNGEDKAGKLVKLVHTPEGQQNPVDLVLDSNLHTMSNEDLQKFGESFQPGDPDHNPLDVSVDGNFKPGGVPGKATLANKCVTENYPVLHISREIKEENGIGPDDHVSFIFGAYGTPEVGATEDTWSPYGQPDNMHTVRINRPMGCVYYGDVIGGTVNNNVAQENTYIDFIENTDTPWEKAFVDSRFDPGIMWEFEDNDGNRKTDRQATREDRTDLLTMEDGQDWRRFRKGYTYKIRLNRGAWCQLTPISADEEMLNWTETQNIESGKSKDDLLEQFTTVFRDETLKLYAPANNDEEQEDAEVREVEITMDRDYLFFSGHSFDTQRSEKYQQPTDINCWSEKGQNALVTVVYIANNVKGPVYYAGDKSVTWAYEYSLPEDEGTGTTAGGSTPQDPADYGIIDFMNPHWRNSPWNVWKPDIPLERGKCYEISIIDFDLVNPDDTVVQPGGKKPQWQDKFSMWFLHKVVNPEIKDINRAFYLEPSSTIEGNEGNLPNPGEDNILEPEYIILDGNSQYTARWSAMFRCITENVVFGVHRDAGNYVSGYNQPEKSDGTVPDIGSVEEFNKAGVPGYFWIREVPDPDAELPTGVAYWAQSNNQNEIEWGNSHWIQPLNTVAPGRITQGQWYKITALPEMDRNNFYRIWWSNDDTGREGTHMGNVYVPTRYGVNEKNPSEPFDVIRFNKEIIVYAEGQHMFFAAYNTTRNKITDWEPDGEPAPVTVEAVDPPLNFIQGSAYYWDPKRDDIWDKLPDFQDEHWAKIHTYQEITHKYPSGTNPENEITYATLPKTYLKDDHVYRLKKVYVHGDPEKDWENNSALLYDCTLYGSNSRSDMNAGVTNSMRHDKIVEVPKKQRIIDIKKVEHQYYVWSVDASNKKIEDWSPFGHPFLADIEDLGTYDDMEHGPAYWCNDNVSSIPPMDNDHWLRPFNGYNVEPGERFRMWIDERSKGFGDFQPYFMDKEYFNTYSSDWDANVISIKQSAELKQNDKENRLDYDEKHGVKEIFVTVPDGCTFMFFGNRHSGITKATDWSRDGAPAFIEADLIPPPEGPLYFADNEGPSPTDIDNIPDYSNKHWEKVTRLDWNFKKGYSYRFHQVPEEPFKYNMSVVGHYDDDAMEVGEKHGGRLVKLGNMGPNDKYIDLKALDTENITFGTKDAGLISKLKLEDWSPRGEDLPLGIEEIGRHTISGPGYWSNSKDVQPYSIDYNNPYWLSPLNYWQSASSSGDTTGTANRLTKGNTYKITALPQLIGCVKLWFTDDETAFKAPGIDPSKFDDGSTTGMGGTIVEYADNNRFPREATFVAKGKYLIFACFNHGRTLEDWSEDGEPVPVKIDVVEDDTSVFGPVYWNDRPPEYNFEIFRNDYWKKVNHVPVSAVREFVGKRASVKQKFLTEDRNYDLDIWFAKNGKEQMDDPGSAKWNEDDWIYGGRWLQISPSVEIEKVPSEYMVMTTRKVDDREDNSITGWSKYGEPLQVELEEVEFEEGPMYWADHNATDTNEKGFVDLSDEYWKQYTLGVLPKYGTYRAKLNNPRKAPYDLILWEAKAGQSNAYYKQKKNWTRRAKFAKGASRDVIVQLSHEQGVFIIGAYNTNRTKKSWSPYGEWQGITFTPDEDDVWGQLLFGHDGSRVTGQPFPLHNNSFLTMPQWNSNAQVPGGKWKDGFLAKAFNWVAVDEDSEVEPIGGDEDFVTVESHKLYPFLNHKIKLKRGSGKWKLDRHTYMSMWALTDDAMKMAKGEMPGKITAGYGGDAYYLGDLGIRGKGNPTPHTSGPGGNTFSSNTFSTRAKNNSNGGNNNNNNNNNNGGDDGGDESKRNIPGPKHEWRHINGDWLLFGQYYAPKKYDLATWPIHGKPIKYDLRVTLDVELTGLAKLIQKLLELLTKIPNIISLFQELDIIIEQNEAQDTDEMGYHNNGNKSMSSYCRWTDASPKFFNTVCDQENRILLRLLKLRYNGLFIHANSEKPNSSSNNSDKWKGMNIMNLTPTFQHGIARMYNDNVRRVLRYYGDDIPRVNDTWGRQSETFWKVDTRIDYVREKSIWDDRLAWFNPQIGWGITQFAQHYYKVRHGKQYRSGTQRVSVGGSYGSEVAAGDTLDNIFTLEGCMMKAIGWNDRNDREKSATFEIYAGADTVWPLNCDERGISLDPNDPSERTFSYYPGIEFTFEYGKFYANESTDDFQILDIYLYFQDPDTGNVTSHKLIPEKSSKYIFRDTGTPESNSSVTSHKMAQRSGEDFTIRAWYTGGILKGDQIFYKMTTTIYMGTANTSDKAHAMIWSNLRPLATSNKPTDEYLIKNVSDLNLALGKDYPHWPLEITDDEPEP